MIDVPKSKLDEAAVGRARFFCTAHLQGDLAGRSIRSGVLTVGTQAVRFLLNLLTLMIMARLLRPADYGVVAMVAPITGFLGLFRDLGLSTATVQRVDITHEQVSSLFWINVLASAVLAVACMLISPLVGLFYHDNRTIWVTVILGVSFLFGGLTAQHHALLKRQMCFGKLARIDLATAFVSAAVGVFTARLGWGYWSLVAMTLVGGAVNCAGVWIANGWRPGWFRWNEGVRDMIRFGGCLTAAGVCGFISGSFDKIVIGRTMGASALGVYNRAFQLLLMPLDQMLSPVTAVLLTALSRTAADAARFRSAVRRVGNVLLMAVTPLAGILIALAPETVLVFLGPAWTEAVPVFRALAVVAVSLPMNHLGSLILQSAGRADVILRWAPFSMAISLASIFLGMPWGLAGIAFGWALGGLVVRTPLFYLFISRSTHVRFWDMMFPVLDYAVPLTLLIVAGSYLRKVFTFESPVASLAVHGSFLCIGYLVYLFITGKHKILLEMVRQVKRAELS